MLISLESRTARTEAK